MSDLLPWYAPYTGWALMGLLAMAGLAMIWRGLLGDRSHGRARCPQCWYDRRGTADDAPCPECGHTPRKPKHLYRTRRRWRWALVGLVIALALPTFGIARRTYQHGPGYWLIYGPGYWLFGEVHTGAQHHGPFTVNHYRDRRTGATWHLVTPGDVELNGWGYRGQPDRYAWRVTMGGEDLNGDGRANLVLRQYAGAGAAFYAILEWDGERADLLHMTSETALLLLDLDQTGVYEWTDPSRDSALRIPLLDFDRLDGWRRSAASP
ncbi:MAG: hypothetical protein WD534_12025 [Phycisphaeraceae bacterium]